MSARYAASLVYCHVYSYRSTLFVDDAVLLYS